MLWLIGGTTVLAGFLLLGLFFTRIPAKTLARVLMWLGIGLGIFLLIGLLAARSAFLLPFLLLGIPVVRRMFQSGRFRFPSMSSGPSPGGTSEVETATLRMVLDHDSGMVQGEVITGVFTGRDLDSLSIAELLTLLDECLREDLESGPLVEAYMDRAHPDWRDQAEDGYQERATSGSNRTRGASGYDIPMDAEEARRILGVERNATKEIIKAAHHRLMKKIHPDQGGSNYLASKINQAKEVLLRS